MSRLTKDVLELADPQREVDRIVGWMREALSKQLRRRGLVLGVSGGIDSAVCAALCVEALGPKKVFGLLMPETDSSSDSTRLGRMVVETLGMEYIEEDVAPSLEAIGCYRWRDDAIRKVFPEYDGTWPHKLVIRGGDSGQVNHFALVAQTPDGEEHEERLKLPTYLQIVAATNFKQRVRKTLEYFHADRLNYAVVGTPNRLEYDQGFFVKNGDGAADLKPIAHLYKTQVYALAAHLGLPEEIQQVTPTTDTYSLVQGQDEFYFSLPYHEMDLALWAHDHEVPAAELARTLGIDEARAAFVYQDIEAKRRTTTYQHLSALTVESVLEQ